MQRRDLRSGTVVLNADSPFDVEIAGCKAADEAGLIFFATHATLQGTRAPDLT